MQHEAETMNGKYIFLLLETTFSFAVILKLKKLKYIYGFPYLKTFPKLKINHSLTLFQ